MVNLAAIQVGGLRYNSPWTQISILGFATFCSVGMFSAVSNLGAGGTQDPQLSDISNSVLYAVFALMGPFAGSVNNILGPRLTFCIGTFGYSIYIGGLWAYQEHGVRWFLILSGAILGATAALLWAAQGSIMMSYPMEKDKGRSFSLFWSIFQLGTLVGSAIALGIEANSDLPAVSTGVYLAFLIIMLTSIFTSWLLLPPNKVVRGDGTVPVLEAAISPAAEFRELGKLFKDWRIVALFPMFISSNYFYAYQNALTAALFNARTRALVALLTGLGSIVGSIMIGVFTDRLPVGRRARALWACAFVLFLNILVWGGGIGFQVQFDRDAIMLGKEFKGDIMPWDWSVPNAAGPIVLLMSYYIADAAFQGLAYYTMSTMTNDPFKLARLAGYYKGVQSAGSAISFGMDAVKTPYLGELLVSWLLLLISLPLCVLVLWKTRETNYDIEGTVNVDDLDETKVEGVALPPGHVPHHHETAAETEAAHKQDPVVSEKAAL